MYSAPYLVYCRSGRHGNNPGAGGGEAAGGWQWLQPGRAAATAAATRRDVVPHLAGSHAHRRAAG